MPSLNPDWAVSSNHLFMELGSVTYVGSPVKANSMKPVSGFNGIAAGPGYVYTYDSDSLKRWNKNTGALSGAIDASPSPPVIATPGVFGSGNVPAIITSWGGLDVDDCDNVYIGVGKEIKVYDASLNLVNTFILPDTIYDLKRTTNNKLYACGRGFVTEIDNTVTNVTYSITVSSVPSFGCNPCNGKATAKVSANVTCGASPFFEYYWSLGGQTTSAITGLCPGNYVVTISDNHIPISADTVVVTSGIAPPVISVTGNNASCGSCSDGSATAVATGSPPFSYQWSPGGHSTTSVSNLLPGTYTICVTDYNNCTICDTITIGFATGINSISSYSSILLYPNPTSGIFQLSIVGNYLSLKNILVYNIFGEEIYHAPVTDHKLIDLSSQPDGIYLLQVVNEKQVIYCGKLIKLNIQ